MKDKYRKIYNRHKNLRGFKNITIFILKTIIPRFDAEYDKLKKEALNLEKKSSFKIKRSVEIIGAPPSNEFKK